MSRKKTYTENQKAEIKRKYEGMINNLNAEVYSEERATELFIKAIDLTKEEEIRTNDKGISFTCKKYDFIGEITTELNTYREIFTHLKKRFPKLDKLDIELHSRVENNCYSNTKKGFIKEATGIVNLKSNYKWTDRTQIDISAEQKKLQDLFPEIPE